FDELYDFLFVKPAMWLGRFLWKKGDGWLIDGLGPDGISARVVDVTRGVVRLQTGYVFHYAFAMLIGVAALVTWFIFGGARVCPAGRSSPSSLFYRWSVPLSFWPFAAMMRSRSATCVGRRCGPRSQPSSSRS